MPANSSFEDHYLAILQNIEASVLRVYREKPELVDLQVDAAIEALIFCYQAEQAGKKTTLPRSEMAKTIYQSIRQVGEWRLGRQGFLNDEGKTVLVETVLAVDEWIACLKRIRKSIQTWNKKNGSQGYLNYIALFIK